MFKDVEQLMVICATLVVLCFLAFINNLITISANDARERFDTCIKAGYSWNNGSCIVVKAS